jgi:hypothetical protein
MLLIWKILTAFALLFLPIVVFIRDWKFSDRRTMRHRRMSRIILCAWLVAGLSSVGVMWSDEKRNAEQLEWMIGSGIPLVIGEIPFINDPHLLVFKAVNNSDFPMHDVSIRVITVNEMQQVDRDWVARNHPQHSQLIPLSKEADRVRQGRVFSLGTLSSHETREFYRIDSSSIDGKWDQANYIFDFDLRTLTGWAFQHMTWLQERDALVNKSWIVYRIKNGPSMQMKVSSPTYSGKNQWDRSASASPGGNEIMSVETDLHAAP